MSAAKDTASIDKALGNAYQLHGMLKCLRMAASYNEEQCENSKEIRAFSYLGLTIESMIPIADSMIDDIEKGQGVTI